MELIIGTRAWSSWSMRPWLALRRTGAAFSETLIPLRRDGTPVVIAAVSPSSKVPVLKDGDLTVWDSLAICEYLADKFPQARLWPQDLERRARGRAAAAEMHSGFMSLRNQCPMDLALRESLELSEGTHKDVGRIVALWRDLRSRYCDDGPFLLGEWSIADAFFTPVATRFRTYRIDPAGYGDDGAARAYCSALLSTPEYLEWERAAAAE
jgi:glutathione S-transferase